MLSGSLSHRSAKQLTDRMLEKFRQPVLFIWSIEPVLSSWLDQAKRIHQKRNQIDQIDLIDLKSFPAAATPLSSRSDK